MDETIMDAGAQTDDGFTDDDWGALESEAGDAGESGGVGDGAGAVPDNAGGTQAAESASKTVPGAEGQKGGDQYYSDDELGRLTVEQVDPERVPPVFRKHWEQVVQKHKGADAKFRESAANRKELEEYREEMRQIKAQNESLLDMIRGKQEQAEIEDLDPEERRYRDLQRQVQALYDGRAKDEELQRKRQIEALYQEIDRHYDGLKIEGDEEYVGLLREIFKNQAVKAFAAGHDGIAVASKNLESLRAKREYTEADVLAFFDKNPQFKAKFLRGIISARKAKAAPAPPPESPVLSAKSAPASIDEMFERMLD